MAYDSRCNNCEEFCEENNLMCFVHVIKVYGGKPPKGKIQFVPKHLDMTVKVYEGD